MRQGETTPLYFSNSDGIAQIRKMKTWRTMFAYVLKIHDIKKGNIDCIPPISLSVWIKLLTGSV